MKKIVALAGGVGGAKLANGFSKILPPEKFSVIVNTGDDFTHLGLKISPDVDTVSYTLADLNNLETGWGRKDETWNVIETLEKLGSEPWFRLGDKDIGLHLERTRLLSQGANLSSVCRQMSQQLNIKHLIMPMTDTTVSTILDCEGYGELAFQEYFVKYKWQPVIQKIEFRGAEASFIPPKNTAEIKASDIVIICPSNPWVSIAPILAVPGYREILSTKVVVAVSPLIGGQTVKGPAAKMFSEMGIAPGVEALAGFYKGTIQGLVIDHQDKLERKKIDGWGIISYETDILMPDTESQVRLAEEVLIFAESLLRGVST